MSRPEHTGPRHPFRDSAILYAFLAVVVVVIAAITGGEVVKAALLAAVAFVVAMGWTYFRFRARAARQPGP